MEISRRQKGCVEFLNACEVILGGLVLASVYPFWGNHH